MINLPGPCAFAVPSGLTPGFIKSKTKVKSYEGHRYPFSCGSSRHVENIELSFPSSVRISRVPRGMNVRTAEESYRSSYKLVYNKLFVTREMTTNVGGDVCMPSQQKAKDQAYILDRVKADLRSQIFVE